MTVSTPQVERLVVAANLSPSAENCQPWSFRWDGEALAIAHDPDRARHVLNHRDDVSRQALGCVLSSLDVAAREEGLSAEARLSLDGPSRSTWATVTFSPTAERGHELCAALAGRLTDRRLYRGGSIPPPVRAALRREAERFPGLRLHVIERFPDELTRFATRADATLWSDPAVYRDVVRWVRFSREELRQAGDGVPWNGAGVDLPEAELLRLMQSPLARSLAIRFGFLQVVKIWVQRQLASSAALLLITARDRSPEAMVQAGRLGLVAWVRLNQAGFSVQPMTIQSLPVYHAATGGLREGTPAESVDLFVQGRGVLERAFGHAPDELPVWMFRTGLSPGPLPLRTPRLPLARILSVVETRPAGQGEHR